MEASERDRERLERGIRISLGENKFVILDEVLSQTRKRPQKDEFQGNLTTSFEAVDGMSERDVIADK